MCGIFGIVAATRAPLNRASLLYTIRKFYRLAESRGKEAAGLAAVLPDRIEVVKRPVRGRVFLKDPAFNECLDAAIAAWTGNPLVIVGHTRMVTNGSSSHHGNNQPVIKNEHVCVHNGIIVNDAQLWTAHPNLNRDYEVDTEVLLAVVERKRLAGQSFSAAVSAAFGEIRGANSIALMSTRDDALVLGSTNGSLFFAASPDRTVLLFASERYILEQVMKHRAVVALMWEADAVQIKPGEAFIVPFSNPQPLFFKLAGKAARLNSNTAPYPADRPSKQARSIIDRLSSGPSGVAPHINNGTWRELEGLMAVDFNRVSQVKRCTHCLLPETFPFIAFDNDGVCQLCLGHEPLRRQDENDLRAAVDSVRRSDGRPECLVPLSGGRDSCYGLHYIKKVLGLNPVAYTYDWGLVTDLARRNISRICEALGVEHILVAADIRRKREFVRVNVAAWLQRPHLGTIPLFMAGDKQLFYFAGILKRQMQLGLIMFSMNRLERTFFKVGFCGIDDRKQRAKTHGLSLNNKLKLVLFYSEELALNYGLVNKSLIDTAFAYMSYYMLPKNYISIFDYVPWSEDAVQDTIIQNYGWETAGDCPSTWRIGDGTAAFYNYIYFRVAGFSEHDTFRSNQIRQGMISRRRALEIVNAENRPRPEAFKWYCDTVGLDAAAALRAINSIPSLYA